MLDNKNVTMTKVAKHAGVSHITVSRVLNDKKGLYPISERTRKKVLASITKLNYRPSAIARSMRTKQTGIIALIYCRDRIAHFNNDFFYMGVQGGIEEELAKNQKNLLICAVNKEDIAHGVLPNAILEGLIDAVIIFEISHPTFINSIQSRNIPLILLNEKLLNSKIDCVAQDNENSFRELTEIIIRLGHKNIALVSSPEPSNSIELREKSFCQVLKDHRLSFNKNRILRVDPWSNEADFLAVDFKHKHENTTAFMCTTDGLAKSTILGLKNNGYSIPDDLSVTGCGGHHPWLFQELNLTTICFDQEEMGKTAAKIILKRLIEKKILSSQIEFLVGAIIEGGTAGPCSLK